MVQSPFRTAWMAAVLVLAVVPPTLVAQDVPEMGVPAINAFAQGMELYAQGNNVGAMERFLEAHEHDPSFAVALFHAGLAAGNAGRAEVVDSAWTILEEQKGQLSPYYLYRFESQKAQRQGDRAAAIAFSRMAVAESPRSKAAYNLAFQLNGIGRAREARDVLLELGHESEPMRNYTSYYTQLVGSYHWLGDYDEAVAVARIHAERFPDNWAPLFNQARALAAAGRTTELEEVFRKAEGRPAGGGVNNLGPLMAGAGIELLGHGHDAAGREVLERADEWMSAQPSLNPATRNWHMFALSALGEWDDAHAVATGLVADVPANPWYHAAEAMTAARTGDRDAAEEGLRWLEERAASTPTNPSFSGYILHAMGEDDDAVRAFEDALAQGWSYNGWWHVDQALVGLRARPDFQAFLAPQG